MEKLVLVTRFPPAHCGIAEYSDYLVRHLTSIREGPAEIVVLAQSDTQPVEDHEPVPGIPVERCWESGVPDYRGLAEALARHLDASVVHFQHDYGVFPMTSEFLELLSWLRRKAPGAKVVVTLHTVKKPVWVATRRERGLGLLEAAERDERLAEYQKAIARLCDVVVVHYSHMALELWMQGVEAPRIKVIPHGTPVNPLVDWPLSALEKVLRVEVPREVFKVGVPGFIRVDKGQDVLLKAVEEASKKIDVVAVVSGEPQGDTGAKAMAAIRPSLAGKHVVRIPGFLSRMRLYALVRTLDLAVLPYREVPGHLGVSGALHLVMGSLVPALCSQVPRLVECSAYAPELVVPPEDPKSLAEKIVWAAENYREVNLLSTRLWQYGVETSWQRVARLHAALYEELGRR